MTDAKQLDRTARYLSVQYKPAHGSPPTYASSWRELWDCRVERIVCNIGVMPNEATLWFPAARWDEVTPLNSGDCVRIVTTDESSDTVVFQGFVAKRMKGFSGGNESGGKYERNAVVCLDYRWLLAVMSPVYGQAGRSADDYNNYGTASQSAKDGEFTFFQGRRCIFNKDGKPNSDKEMLNVYTGCQMPLFGNPSGANSVAFTAKEMIQYLLSPYANHAYKYFQIGDPGELSGLDHEDWEKVINHVSVEGLNTITAIQTVCKNIGWNFRQDYDSDGNPTLHFFKSGSASSTSTLHSLYAPPANDSPDGSIKTAVSAGKVMLWAAEFEDDITGVVNNPWGLGSVHRFEFTAELVPAWLDDDLEPDTSDSYAHLFIHEADITETPDIENVDYFKNYHSRGSSFKREVGRIWALNESGRYTNEDTYDRGMPFDFSTVIDPKYSLSNKKRSFGGFDRKLLNCLTKDKEGENSVGIIVEFSFDGGTTWEKIPAAIKSLEDQCGIYIAEPNLAEIMPNTEADISGGDLDGIELNYFSSLCYDKLEGNIFKTGQWKTRLRVTASVQLDQRLNSQFAPTASGSPFHQRDLMDFSDRYYLQKRQGDGDGKSIFADSDYSSNDRDDSKYFGYHLQHLRDSLQDSSISGQYTLERLWLSEFRVGDCIKNIEGRGHSLQNSYGRRALCPEIVQIIILPQKQKMKLITRDLRFSESR